MERICDQNFRAAYGAWDAIKNVEKRYPAHRLNGVAYVAGKRESRRLLRDVVLTGEDLRDGRVFDDGCFPCTWGIDTHHPDTKYAAGHDISVTHATLGAVRVMKTTGAMGEIVGMAAAVCHDHDCTPRQVYAEHLGALQERMRRGAGR